VGLFAIVVAVALVMVWVVVFAVVVAAVVERVLIFLVAVMLDLEGLSGGLSFLEEKIGIV
jgi:hypothetical protein